MVLVLSQTSGKSLKANSNRLQMIKHAVFVQVYVNGLQHCTFKHRIPLENVSAIDIRGHVAMSLFGFIGVSKREKL